MGCPNCLKRFVARMSPCLRLAPTVPAGRKYDPLLVRGNVKLLLLCGFKMHPTLSDVFFGQRAASTG